jgi:hypothetical protein
VAEYRCELCWAVFESPVALLLHEAAEDDRLYDLNTEDAYDPSTNADTQCDE